VVWPVHNNRGLQLTHWTVMPRVSLIGRQATAAARAVYGTSSKQITSRLHIVFATMADTVLEPGGAVRNVYLSAGPSVLQMSKKSRHALAPAQDTQAGAM
jgi:hypothetical protein